MFTQGLFPIMGFKLNELLVLCFCLMKRHARNSEKVEYGANHADWFGYGADDAEKFRYGAGNAGGFTYSYRTNFSDSFQKIFSEVICFIIFMSIFICYV